jgi:DNA-binding winged helix-turn-helix (wHTH) protein
VSSDAGIGRDLVEHEGALMTREQIADALWGKDVFVDVEQGINTAIRKIRMALEDDSVQPRYLQTVVSRGYRFVGEIRVEDEDANSGQDFRITAEEFGQALMAAAGLEPEEYERSRKPGASSDPNNGR